MYLEQAEKAIGFLNDKMREFANAQIEHHFNENKSEMKYNGFYFEDEEVVFSFRKKGESHNEEVRFKKENLMFTFFMPL